MSLFDPMPPQAADNPFEPMLQSGQYARQRSLTLDDLLLEQRIIFLSWPINNEVAARLRSLRGLTVGLQICYDLRFPELTRLLTGRGAELIVLQAAWGAGLF